MKHIKKIYPILIGTIMLMQFMPASMSDQTSDTFDITVTGEFLWIDITNATWAIGTVAMSSSTYTNGTGADNVTFLVGKWQTSVVSDIKLQITNDGADWTAATAGNPAAGDVYRLNSTIDTAENHSGAQWVKEYQLVTASATTINTSIAVLENESFDLRFDAPTSTTTSAQQSITVTATISKS